MLNLRKSHKKVQTNKNRDILLPLISTQKKDNCYLELDTVRLVNFVPFKK